jgi:hypothetical protein
VSSYYAARIAAARSALKPGDIAAALRALQNERAIAMRAVIERWQAASRNATQSRHPFTPAQAPETSKLAGHCSL